jgi:hypothetical protein
MKYIYRFRDGEKNILSLKKMRTASEKKKAALVQKRETILLIELLQAGNKIFSKRKIRVTRRKRNNHLGTFLSSTSWNTA